MPARVLIVDDEHTMRQLLRTHLKRQSYEVLESENAEVALPVVRTEGLDLVITDVNLGVGQTGMALLQEIKKIQPDLPVIIMTGIPNIDDAIECMKNGAVDYISKPFKIKELKKIIATALDDPTASKTGTELTQSTNYRRILAGYQIIRTLGEGNVGTVYLVQDRTCETEKLHALKILKPFFKSEERKRNALERLLREAEAIEGLKHPNIVGVIEYGLAEEELVPYILMEYIEGGSLRNVITNNDNIDYKQKAEIIRQVASALAAVHKHNICHRDIKPANILINDAYDAKLTDFGIALMPDSSLTMTANIVGTPVYLSPEGFKSSKVDHRSDIFSLGVVTYELMLGQRPFVAESIARYATSIQTECPIEPRKLRPDFPPRLQFILARMMKKDPDERYNDATELVDDIQEYIDAPPSRTNILSLLVDRLRHHDWR